MILENLTLTDFRVFQGQHSFDLTPRIKYGKTRPIILYGGLNGAGKTTTLTAVRLALYGKQSLGKTVSKTVYDNFLRKSIHTSKNGNIQAATSCIELTFSYANMGVLKHYTVKRQWMVKGKTIFETLSIAEDGNDLSELNAEQCQGFLNELIPIGVSDLFFFDSEKIAELAHDTGGVALGEAIKKLLGLDVLETLNADLGVLLRGKNKESAALETQKQITALEKNLEKIKILADSERDNYQNLLAAASEASNTINQLELDLSARGGAWAATREKELEKQSHLYAEKVQLERTLQELIDGSFPLSLAPMFAKKTLKQLINESDQKKLTNTSDIVIKHVTALDKKLKKLLDKNNYDKTKSVIDKEFGKLLNKNQKIEIIHDISETLLRFIDSTITKALHKQSKKVKDLGRQLDKVNSDIDKAGKNIARAPEETLIKPVVEKIRKAQERRTKNLMQQKIHIENRKRYLREAMDITRKLSKLSDSLWSEDEKDRTVLYANNSKLLLTDFSKAMAKRKIHDLENEFITSFHRLSRKEDISLRAKINPETFTVKLTDSEEREIDKNDLSAGEKQIYAIAILEALARTSGRKLPIIIDTPLARLDSVHRANLIQNYFPYASHQVIILSTDTEVDEEFYSELSPHISHAYKLNYSSIEKHTTAKEGYFWKTKKQKVAQ